MLLSILLSIWRTNIYGYTHISDWDVLFSPFYVAAIIIVANIIKNKRIRANPIYKYYVWGLAVKIIGGMSVCLIYTQYYYDGDTTGYYHSALCMLKLGSQDIVKFMETWFAGPSFENYLYFNNTIGYPLYWFDPPANFVCRIAVPFVFLGAGCFMPAAILMAWVTYFGIWKMYEIFCEQFPALSKQFAIAILFMPSVFFWGSGILKDAITFSALSWYTYAFYSFFIKKKYSMKYVIIILIAAYFIIKIKPYILFALMPGSIIWLFRERIQRIKNQFFRTVFAPFILTMGLFLAYYLLANASQYLGEYSLENALFKAQVSNIDMKESYYQGNSFSIGDFEPTISSAMSVAHLAIFAGLFYPTLIQVKNVVMMLAALENTYILALTVYLLFKLKLFAFFGSLFKDPLLMFTILFSIFFAFAVGISVSNFGTLVRLRIPCIPFYMCSLFILKHFYDENVKKKSGFS